MRAAETIGESARDHLPRSGDRPLHARLERQRGLKSFLTWAFFLAQISAAEQLLTGAAKAQDDESSGNPAKPPETSSPDLLAENAIQKNIDEAQPEAITSSSAGSSTSHVPPLDGSTSTQAHPQLLSPATAGTPPPIGGAAGAGASGSAAHTRVGSSGNPDNSLPSLLPDLHLGGQIAPAPVHVEANLGSLLGFELNLGGDGLIAADIDLDLGNLGNIVIAPLREVTDLVGPLTDELGSLLNGTGLALGELLDNDVDLSELTGLNLTDGLSALLEQHGAELPEQDAQIVGGTTDEQTDVLFIDGRYTNYNIALRESAAPVADAAAMDAAPANESGTTDAAPTEPPSPPHHNQSPSDTAIVVELLPLDELEARPA